MLTELHITDFALVHRLALTFGPGLNVLTGETGAGKSIIIDAIGSVLGDRAGPELVRAGADRARIDATFEIGDEPHAAGSGVPVDRPEAAPIGSDIAPNGSEGAANGSRAAVDASDRPTGGGKPKPSGEGDGSGESRLSPTAFAEDGLLLITREISRAGRSGIRLNGRPATLAMVREVTDPLVDVHGQHEHQSLLLPEHHVDILDQWVGREALSAREAVRAAHRAWSDLQRERNRLVTDERERTRRLDLLRYQADEIDAADLRPGEEEELAADRARLAGAEKLFASAAEAMVLLAEDERNAVDMIGVAAARLRDAAAIDAGLGPTVEAIENALFTLEEAARDLGSYRDEIEFNPERLAEVEDRIDLLRRLRRKYGDTLAEILAHRDAARQEIEALEQADERSAALDDAIAAAYADLERRCRALTDLRRSGAPGLERTLMRELADLGMEKTRFSVRMEPAPPGPLGAEAVEFLLSANPGEPLKPLARVASGGEISRIMLAIKSVAARAGGVPVMIFDEVDVGVGGRTGTALAAKLRALGEQRQVLCVTHLPQIAAAAHHHFSIQKREQDRRTVVEVREVAGSDRVDELARMLGGATGAAIEHARDLLGRYQATPDDVQPDGVQPDGVQPDDVRPDDVHV